MLNTLLCSILKIHKHLLPAPNIRSQEHRRFVNAAIYANIYHSNVVELELVSSGMLEKK